MKLYVTYTRKQLDDRTFLDPNTNDAVSKETNGLIIFNETFYEVKEVCIAWIEFDGRSINPQELEYFRTLDPDFNFKIETEGGINKLLSELGDVSVKDFVFTDNRPKPTF